jgi:hypothetical protein
MSFRAGSSESNAGKQRFTSFRTGDCVIPAPLLPEKQSGGPAPAARLLYRSPPFLQATALMTAAILSRMAPKSLGPAIRGGATMMVSMVTRT